MNDSRPTGWRGLPIAAFLGLVFSLPASAERVHFRKPLSPDEIRCFNQLFQASRWGDMPEWKKDMLKAAKVGRAELDDHGQKQYLYLIEGNGWCGTAGCKLLIGEMTSRGVCRLLYDDDGSDNITVLRRRDSGFHRLYTPCEARFNGRQYRQLHAECPNLDIQR